MFDKVNDSEFKAGCLVGARRILLQSSAYDGNVPPKGVPAQLASIIPVTDSENPVKW